MIEFTLDLKIVSANATGHWIKRYNLNKKNAAIIKKYWLTLKPKPKAPCTVTLERIYSPSFNQKKFDAHDNLRTSFKGVVDIIADLLVPGLPPGKADDEVHGITWEYLQTKGPEPRVRIKIEERP